MSSSGQGDSKVEDSKDDEGERTSTVDNRGEVSVDTNKDLKSVNASFEPIAAEDAPAIKNVEASDINTNTPVKEIQVNTVVKPSDKITDQESNDTVSTEEVNADDKDSCSISEDLELKWDEDDDDDESVLAEEQVNEGTKDNPTQCVQNSVTDVLTDQFAQNSHKIADVLEIGTRLDQADGLNPVNPDSMKHNEISYIENKNDKESASTSECQNIDKININEEKEMETDLPFEESNKEVDTDLPEGMDITTDPSIDISEDDTKLVLSKEHDKEILTESPINTDKSNTSETQIALEDTKLCINKGDDKVVQNKEESKLGIITPNVHHRINKPNVMLDIPIDLQGLSDADLDDDDLDFDANSAEKDTIDKENLQISDTTEKKPHINKNNPIEIHEKSSSIDIILKDAIEAKSLVETTVTVEQNDTNQQEVTEEDVTQEQSELVKGIDVKPKIHIDVMPSTSKAVIETLASDVDSDPEVSDSLGLLAESSRVMDDDNDDDVGDDAEDQDCDGDEDFDPYEETNSSAAEDMDASTPLENNPNLERDKRGRESDEDVESSSMDVANDIDCVEDINTPSPSYAPKLEDMDKLMESGEVQENMENVDDIECIEADSEVVDADKPTTRKQASPPDKIINILEKVLGPQTSTGKESPATSNVRNYVEVEGSSDSDDEPKTNKAVSVAKDVVVHKEVKRDLPEPTPESTSTPDETQDTVLSSTAESKTQEKLIDAKRDEVFNLDSDDDDDVKKVKEIKIKEKTETKAEKEDEKVPDSPKTETPTPETPEKTPEDSKAERKCINPSCKSETRTYYPADRATAAYYSLNRRRAFVCDPCRRKASERSQALINGIKELCPLLELDMEAPSQQLVEISDSDSDGEGGDLTDRVGERGAKFLEEHLADMINETWKKYNMEARLKDTETYLLNELDKMEADAKDINAILDECQENTDKIRFDFYKDYEIRRKNVGAIVIHDTPFSSYSHTEKDMEQTDASNSRYPKRRAASTSNETPAKKQAIPMGYMPLNDKTTGDRWKAEDDKEDISVVKLSAEAAPPELPPPGDLQRPPLIAGMSILAMRNAFGTWLKGRIVEVMLRQPGQQFTQCRVKFEHKVKNPCKVLAGRCLAYPEPSKVRLTIGTRVVALFKDPHNTTRREALYGGVIAEIPNPVNNYRYLVFFDDGYAQYVHHQDTRIVCESSHLVWEEVHPFIRDFIYKYLLSYPERPMVRLHAGEGLKTEWNGKWWDSKVLKVDASIALIHFDEDNRTEWIYRGSTRLAPLYLELQAARAGEGKGRSRLPRSKAQMRSNMPCVEYTRSDEQTTRVTSESQQQNEEMRRQRAVAKKSTAPSVQPPAPTPGVNLEGFSRVVYYTPKNAVKPYKMTPHTCGAQCRRTDLLTMKDLRTYNPLAKPLLSGWERQTVRYKSQREVMYRAPCGRRLRSMAELHRYLRATRSDMPVDLFDFTPGTHCLAEFVLSKCNVSKKDLSHGKENVPVPCVNYYDSSLPEFCSYNTERTPTAGVPLNLDPEFLCGCDCTDDCQDKTKCACWKMTLEGARTIGLEGLNVGYVYRRLPEPLPSGIYECNSRCKCKQTCLNRVAQHPLQLKLQVFKTSNRGWGIRALNDVPKGSFLCVYAGNLLTDATANLDGLNEGDEYLAELDYIEVVEAMKEGYEDDVPEEDKKLDKKAESESESEPTSESEDETETNKDGDFQPGYIGHTDVQFKKSLRKREKAKKKQEEKIEQEGKKKEEAKKKEDCITISDDEEVREPSRFTAEDGMVDKDLITKQSSRVSVRTLFGKDEACYIMDAKVQGNIGRYLNHSCHPNVFVQNVFVDTHDPRFPWVAFFALSHVKAGTELTWNYNYDVGSVPEKVLYCYCGAPNCRGRLL